MPVCAPLLDGNERRYLNECLDSNWISSIGPFVERFEHHFADQMGCAYGVSCTSGTTALHLTLTALGIGPGDEVIIPAFTMIAVANAVSLAGAVPVLVDVSRDDWNLDADLVDASVTARTKAIVAVHTYGHPAAMNRINEIALRHKLFVVEDAAEAHGAEYRGLRIGSLGKAAVFSFYANKIITTGEGGMITTNDRSLADLAKLLRDHAFSSDRHFWHEHRAFNYRMTNLQAAVGLAQSERLTELVAKRRANAKLYRALLDGVTGLRLPAECGNVKSVFWMYALLVNEEYGCSRDELRQALATKGIETRTFFIPIHLQPAYYDQYCGQRFPVAETLCQQGLSTCLRGPD